MSLLNVFKKKKDSEKIEKPLGRSPATGEAAPIKNPKLKKSVEDTVVQEPEKPKKEIKLDLKILKAPHITEKATSLGKRNQYVFEVGKKANKTEIKKIIKKTYNVDVISVNIINIPKKRMRLGKISGWKKGYKKAIVRIKKGQKIEIA